MTIRNSPPLSEAVAQYLVRRKEIDDLAERSLDSETRALARFVRFVQGRHAGRDLQVARMTKQDVQAFFVALKQGDKAAGCQSPQGDAAMSLFTSRVKGFMQHCVDEGWLRTTLMPQTMKKRKRKPPRRNWLILTPEQLHHCLTDANPRDRAIIACAMNTGLRTNEMQGMTYGDVNFDTGRIFTHITKGDKTVDTRITEDLEIELRRWIAFYRDHIGGEIPLDAYLFPAWSRPYFKGSERGHVQHLEPYNRIQHPERIAKDALRRIGVPEEKMHREGMHTFRRSAARMVFDYFSKEAGYSNTLEWVSKWLNHALTETTEGYLNISAPDMALDKRLIGKPFISAIMAERTGQTGEVIPLRAVNSAE